MADEPADPWVRRLARLFAEHPAWVAAARHLDPRATSTVHFSHCPGERWRLERQGDTTLLLPGPADDPDFVFRFTPGAIERLEAVRGGIGEFAVQLFTCLLDDDPQNRVELRIVADFPRLRSRGYVGLLIAAGPRVLAFGFSHGIRTLSGLRRLVAQLRARDPQAWEEGG